jgi:hypothetical protein
MFSTSIHIIPFISTSFPFYWWKYSIGWIFHIWLSIRPVHWHLGCFYLLAIKNNTTICIQLLCRYVISFLSLWDWTWASHVQSRHSTAWAILHFIWVYIYLGIELLDQMITVFSFFGGTARFLSKVLTSLVFLRQSGSNGSESSCKNSRMTNLLL